MIPHRRVPVWDFMQRQEGLTKGLEGVTTVDDINPALP